MAILKGLVNIGDARITGEVFGNGFHKTGSSDSYVLLGGGGHKALSDFAMSDAYLPLAGGTMTGAAPITFTPNTLQMELRPGHTSYNSRIQYSTPGNEAVMWTNANAVTSFIFKCGASVASGFDWTGFNSTFGNPTLQLKKQAVYVNKWIGHNVTPDYNFYVNGTSKLDGNAYATALIHGTTSARADGNLWNTNGSYTPLTWANVGSKPGATGSATQPVYWGGTGFILANSYPTVNNNKITFQANGTGYRDFTANQSSDTTLNFVGGTGIALAGETGKITVKHTEYTATTPGLNKIGRDGLGHVVIGATFSIPTVNNGQLTLQVNGATSATFTANQSGNTTFNVAVGNGKMTFKANGTGYRDFTANQTGNTDLNFAPGTGIAITGSTGTVNVGINSTYQTYISHGETAYNRKYWANVETSATSSETTEPTVKTVTVKASANNQCKLQYDATVQSLKFVF